MDWVTPSADEDCEMRLKALGKDSKWALFEDFFLQVCLGLYLGFFYFSVKMLEQVFNFCLHLFIFLPREKKTVTADMGLNEN